MTLRLPQPLSTPVMTDQQVAELEHNTFSYFWRETNPRNGLIADHTQENPPASIAGVGFALAAYPVGVERQFVTREEAAARALTTLRFFWESAQGPERDATGHRGFYYHFLDVTTGRRAWNSELSTIDSAILLAGALTSAAYFDRANTDEQRIRELADALYRRADWRWAQHGGATVAHAWKPARGFTRYRWEGYNEALILYVLGLGSPDHPLTDESYDAWARSYEWKTVYDHEFLYGGPLFMHQLSHIWIDFRGIQDAFMRSKHIDYFENSRRATYVQQAYAMHNPKHFAGYGEHIWGITASNGPGPARRRVGGIPRKFLGYYARGVPYGPDDGTVAPWGVAASLPFASEIVLPAVGYYLDMYPQAANEYGLVCSFNPTFVDRSSKRLVWISNRHFALDQGPVLLMIENYRSGLIWRLMRRCPYIVEGLRRAGFTGGWLRDQP